MMENGKNDTSTNFQQYKYQSRCIDEKYPKNLLMNRNVVIL